jgi:sterol desaturase/sphingolipid hydroxylase (fatty acid hydroxylase superfamily)
MFELKHSVYLITPLIYYVTLGNLTPVIVQVLIGTALRYLVAFVFNVISCTESFVSNRRIQDKNPPKEQMERENDWDDALVFSVIAFSVVDLCTPFFNIQVGLSWESFTYCFLIGHYFFVEPVYWLAHYSMHNIPGLYRLTHFHHHKSIVTMARSGTSHPIAENLYYMANFSLAFLVPAYFNQFSPYLIAGYMVWFDIMNSIGHCNFEVMPSIVTKKPFKYFIYNSCYHTLHHTHFKVNYCLFCPIWDYIFNTVSKKNQLLYNQTVNQDDNKIDAVFLGHSFGLNMNCFRYKHFFIHKSTLENISNNMWSPFTYLFWKVVRFCTDSLIADRYRFDKIKCETWGLALNPYNYIYDTNMANKMLFRSIICAHKRGAKYIGLGAMNKSVIVNNNGEDIVRMLESYFKEPIPVRIIHGNTLTSALVYNKIKELVKSGNHKSILMTGGTSTIGKAVLQRLVDDLDITILVYTKSKERFNLLYKSENMVHVSCMSEVPKHCTLWCTGSSTLKSVRSDTIVVDFAAPSNKDVCDSDSTAPVKYYTPTSVLINKKLCDITFCHLHENTIPSCLLSLMIHAQEDLDVNEVGEVDSSKFEYWLDLYNKSIKGNNIVLK